MRLQDIAATLEGRVEPLRQQAEVAKQFLKLSEQQKKLELSLWMQQLTGLDQEKAALRDTLLQARGNEQNAALDLKQADALLQEQYREMQQTTVRIQNLRESVQQAEETAAQTQADKKMLLQRNKLLQNSCKRSRQPYRPYRSKKLQLSKPVRNRSSSRKNLPSS